MEPSDRPHDSIVRTEASAPQAERMSANEIVERLGARPRLNQRYDVRNEVGRGAMGAVLRVWDADLRRQLAVKVMLAFESEKGSRTPSQESSAARRYARFLEEAQITGQLDHPGIVPVHEIGLDANGRLYFTMKLVRGRELREVLELVRKGEEGWNLTRALNVLLRVGEAMAFAHEKGVIHRDLKPDNVMVGRFGEVYVMDWGLAKVLGAKDTHDLRLRRADGSHSIVRTERQDQAQEGDSPLATMDGDIVGTPCYMPPEQARGRLDDIGPHSDVYSVGAILYEILGGQMPYCAPGDRPSPQAVLGALINSPPTPLRTLRKDLPDELVAICEKAMARDIAARYPSMSGLTEDLRAYLEGRVVSAYESGSLAEFRKWIGRNRAFALTVGAALVIGFGSLFGMLETARRKNLELSAQRDELSRVNEQLGEKSAALESKAAELASTNEELTTANSLAKRNEELARSKEDLAKRMSYAAGIAAADASLKINDVEAARARLLVRYNEDLRDWEWVHLFARCDTSVRQLTRFDGRAGAGNLVTHVAADRAGRLLAICGQDSTSRQSAAGTVRLLDVERLTERGEIALVGGALEALAVSPDGARVALVSSDHIVRVYAVGSSTPQAQWQGPRTGAYRAALAFTPDGSELVAALSASGLTVLSAEDAQPVREIKERMGTVNALACSADGARLGVALDEGEIAIFELTSGRRERTLGERAASVRALAFSPDGQRLLASSGLARGPDPRRGPWLFTVREWELASGRLVSTWQDHQASVNWCDYAAGGRLVVSVSDDRSIRVRDTLRGDAWSMLGHTAAVTAGALTAGGAMLATGSFDGVVREWSPWLGEFATLAGHRRALAGLHCLADAERVVSAASDGGVRVWDSRSALLLAIVQPGESGQERRPVIAAAPDSALFALAGPGGRVRLYDVDSAQVVRTLECGDNEQILALAFSSDGARVAAAVERGLAYVWSVDGGAPGVLRGARGQAVRLAWLENDSMLAVGTLWQAPSSGARVAQRVSELNVFDVERRVSMRLLENLPGVLFALEASPDGETLLLGWQQLGAQSVLRRVAVRSLEPQGADLKVDAQHALWFGDSRLVAAGRDSGVQLIDPGSGEIELALHVPLELTAVTVSSDGQRIMAGYVDGSIRVWSSDKPHSRHLRRTKAVEARTRALEAFERALRTEELALPTALEQVIASAQSQPAELQAARDIARLIDGDTARLLAEVRETCRSARREPIDYTLALLQATQLRRTSASDLEGWYAEGLALLRLGRAEAAARSLASALAGKSGRELDETRGLLALALLRAGQRSQARTVYEEVRRARAGLGNIVDRLVVEPVLDPITRDLSAEVEAACEALLSAG